MTPSRPLPDGSESSCALQCSVAAGALSHDFVVEDARISSLLSQTHLVLVGQPHPESEHVIVSVINNACVPETLAGIRELGKPAKELFPDGVADALQASLRDNESFSTSFVPYDRYGSEILGEAVAASHVLMLKHHQTAHSTESAAECLTSMRKWAACTCTVSISSDPDVDESPRIQSVSRQFSQETGHSASTLLDLSLTGLYGPGTSGASKKSLHKMMQACVSGERKADTDKKLANKSCSILFYRRSGEPWIANVRVIRFPAPPAKSKEAQNSDQENSTGNSKKRFISCLLSFANITAASCPAVGDITLGRVLGSGAFGTVHIGKQRGYEGSVAVKVVNCRTFRDLGDLDAMRNEIAVMATLRHPHIIDLLDSAYVDDRIFIVLEFAPGGDLKDYIAAQDGGRLQEQEARRIFGQCVSALSFCQRKRICHRDLKPENILLDADQNVKIADFGLASIVTPGSDHLRYCGTPAFSAPELFGGGHCEVNPADIWSLGVVLYECLCGELPFRGSDEAALIKQIRSAKYRSLPHTLSDDVKDLVSKMLIVDPEERVTIDEIMSHAWYLPPAGAVSGLLSTELCILPPEENELESSIDDCRDNQAKDGSGYSPVSQKSPSGSRHLKHLHSSVLVTFDEADLVSNDGSTPDSDSTPAPNQTGFCMSPEEPSTRSADISSGSLLQELKPAIRRSRTALFVDSAKDGAAVHTSKAPAEGPARLPKLGNTKRSVSMGGSLAIGVSPAGNSGGAEDVSKPAPTPLPSARRARTGSVSSPGDSTGETDKIPRPQKGSAPRHGIAASR